MFNISLQTRNMNRPPIQSSHWLRRNVNIFVFFPHRVLTNMVRYLITLWKIEIFDMEEPISRFLYVFIYSHVLFCGYSVYVFVNSWSTSVPQPTHLFISNYSTLSYSHCWPCVIGDIIANQWHLYADLLKGGIMGSRIPDI